MLRTVCLGLLGFTLASCNGLGRRGKDPTSDVKATADTVYAGQGYDSDTFQTKDECIVGVKQVEDQPVGDFSFKKIEDWEIAKREMGFTIEGEYTYGVAKVTAKTSFTRNLQDTDLTATYLLSASALGRTTFIKNPQLAKEHLDRFEANDAGKRRVRRQCGNRFVSQVDSGGMLRVMVKFHFANKSVKNNFSFSGGVEAGVAKVNTSTFVNTEDEKKNSSAEIHVYQEGGSLANLGQIIDPTAVVECSLDKWDQCQAMLVKILDYSSKTFLKDVTAPGGTRNYAYKTEPYYDVDFAPLSEAVQEKRLATTLEMERQDYDKLKVSYLLKDRENFTLDERKRELESMNSVMSRNISKLTSNLINCVEYPEDLTRCKTIAALGLEAYDQTRLKPGSNKIVGAPLGGTGGQPFEQLCRNFMTGAQGTKGDIIDQLAVICDDGRQLSTGAKNQADGYYNKSCPSGQVVTGMRGDKGKHEAIASLTFTCSSLADLRAANPKPATSEFVIAGKGGPFKWDCPAGLAAVGLQGNSEKYLNNIALVCVSF